MEWREAALARPWHDLDTQFDSELGWSPLGFRSEPLNPAKKKIVLLGDSVVWGYGVADHQTASYFLEQKLRDKGYQVVNLGVSGYSLDQEYLYLKKNLNKLQPLDSVILIVCPQNDWQETPSNSAYGKRKPILIDGAGNFIPPKKIRKYCLRNIFSRSYWIQRILGRYPGFVPYFSEIAGDKDYPQYAARLNGELIKRMAALSQENHAAFHAVLSPVPGEWKVKTTHYTNFETLFQTLGYETQNFLSVLKKFGAASENFYSDDCHYNEKGHRLLADFLEVMYNGSTTQTTNGGRYDETHS